ncbi:2-dehydro-3-deoxygluconokinase [Arachidicoccus rhizosphaerae]|uniref:2-dehydro-3-deoxygluconokinase n=1 Tax=Arachidicoccus rhizosphaerae TaxID=551991 RepID=A0A1H4AXS6_9BACT|nr:sugar kinase [Arachidicoccus rhizosphaerae]SEA40646.1 2-dehydro-3-deoxygluconokinase [Arachidicoccus rhizosphaerae]
MQEILCFGELLLRLSPEAGWPAKGGLSSYIGGAELNVAMALAGWQIPVAMGTALPASPVTDLLKVYLNQGHVTTRTIIEKEGRIGTYYLTPGADLKSAGVVYDRAYSAFSLLTPKDVDFDAYLQGISHLHLTAISPAVSQTAADSCLALVEAASRRAITISLDLNYRSKLWKYGKAPIDIIPAIASHATFIMGNIWAAGQMLGIDPESGADQTMDPDALAIFAKKSAEKLTEAYPTCQQVGYTFRFNAPQSEEAVRYFGCLYQKGVLYQSRQKDYDGIADRAGSGDCFMAGLLYGNAAGLSAQQTVDFATAAATGKFYEKGDHTRQSLETVEKRVALLNA